MGNVFNGSGMTHPLKILFKYPSRGRRERFFQSLDSLYNNISDPENFRVAITIDDDDPVMSDPEVRLQIESSYPNHILIGGLSTSKVNAINRDLPDYGDIIVVVSDDIVFTYYGFDHVIRSCFQDGLDWHVHIPDQDEKDKLPVLYIAGRTFYKRFGEIYPSCYKSLFPDTEMMEVAKELNLYKYFNYPGMFLHLLPAYGHLPADEMWNEQQRIGWTEDQTTYLQRKASRLNKPDVMNDWFDAFKHDSL